MSVRISAAEMMLIVDTLRGSLNIADAGGAIFTYTRDSREALKDNLMRQLEVIPLTTEEQDGS